MSNSTDLIDRAADYLDSEETIYSYEPRGLHIHHDSATAMFWLVKDDDLADLGQRLADGDDDAYSHWCGMGWGQEVDVERIVLDYDARADTDLAALATEAGAADDMVSFMALTFLTDEAEGIIAQNAEIAAENAADRLANALTAVTHESGAVLVAWLGGNDSPEGHWPTDDEQAFRDALHEVADAHGGYLGDATEYAANCTIESA